MILLTVKVNSADLMKRGEQPGEFDNSWYRLVNCDTSQTIDYKLIKDV